MGRISGYDSFTEFATNDTLLGVDVSDTSMAATGTTKEAPISLIDARYLRIANNLSDLNNASTARTNLGLAIGTNVQAYSANLDEYAAVNPTTAGLALLDDANAAAQLITLGLTATAAELNILDGATLDVTELNYVDGVTSAIQTQLDAKQPLDSDLTTIAGLTATTDNFIVSVSSAWASRTPTQVRTTLGLVIGTNVQAYSANLDEYAAVNPTAAGLALLDDADAAAQRTTLGLVAGGAGDIWVEKAGDTMTGNLVIGDDHFLNVDGSVVFNETGANVDWRVESDTNINGLKLVGSSGNFGVGVDPTERLHIVGSAFLMQDADTETKAYRWRTNGGGLDVDFGGAAVVYSGFTTVGFGGTQYYYLWMENDEHTAYLHGQWRWRQGNAGGDQGANVFVINADDSSGDMVVFNEDGNDYDLRMETDNITGALFLDASNDALHLMNSTTGKLSFYGATATGRPTGVAVTAAGIHAALVTLGLITA